MRSHTHVGKFAVWAWMACLLPVHAAFGQSEGDEVAARGSDLHSQVAAAADPFPNRPDTSIFGLSIPGGWKFSGSGATTETFDDNIFLAGDENRQGDLQSNLQFRGSATFKSRRLRFEADFVPRFSLYNRFDQLNYFSESYIQDAEYRLSARQSLHWTATISHYPARANGAPSSDNFGIDTQALQSPQAILQGTTTTQASTGLGFSRSVSARTQFTANANVSYNEVKPDTAVPNAIFQTTQRSRSLAGSLGWSYTLSPGRTIGLQADYSYFLFSQDHHHQNYENAQLRFEQRVRKHFRAYLSGGPAWQESSVDRTLGRQLLTYTAAGGLSYDKNNDNINLSYTHSQQLATLPTGLNSDLASLLYQRRWKRFVSSASVGYSRTVSEINSGLGNTYYVSGGSTFNLTGNTGLSLNYSRMQERSSANVALLVPQFERNQYSLGLTYHFNEKNR